MLEDLHAALQTKTAAAITQPQAVHGLGGVGKTQLAVEYAWRHQADYDVALWAGAESSTALQANVAALAKVLSLPEAKEETVQVETVMNWLREHERWLLILDNADSKEAQAAVQKLLPPGLPGHVIVTSRRADWPVGFEDLEVPVLPEKAAKEFLINRAGKGGFKPGNDAEALKVANELGCLPLALEQAGAYIAKHRVGFADYLRLLKESRERLLKFPGKGGTGYQKTVAETWLVSEQQLSPTARAILQMVAFLAPDEIPRALFIEGHAVVAEAVGILIQKDTELTKHDVDDALSELFGLSLIELEPETFSCHRLLQAVLHDRLDENQRKEWAGLVLRSISDFAPADPSDVRTWPVWDRLRPHTTAILKEVWGQTDSAVSSLMNQLAALLHAKALHAEAEPLMRRALAIDETSYGPEHPAVAIRLNNLARCFRTRTGWRRPNR